MRLCEFCTWQGERGSKNHLWKSPCTNVKMCKQVRISRVNVLMLSTVSDNFFRNNYDLDYLPSIHSSLQWGRTRPRRRRRPERRNSFCTQKALLSCWREIFNSYKYSNHRIFNCCLFSNHRILWLFLFIVYNVGRSLIHNVLFSFGSFVYQWG